MPTSTKTLGAPQAATAVARWQARWSKEDVPDAAAQRAGSSRRPVIQEQICGEFRWTAAVSEGAET